MISLASCGLIGNKPTAEITDTDVQDTPVIEEKTVIKPDDNEKKDEEEEEVADDRPDDPPYVKTLRTGVFGYEYRTEAKDLPETETIIYVYSDGSRAVVGSIYPNDWNGPMRQICDYENDEYHVVWDNMYIHDIIPGTDAFFLQNKIPDYRAGMEQTGHGTADCSGEMLDYIDYISGEVEIRFFLKDGDVYAIRSPESDKFTYFLTATYSAPPTVEYFEIPDDYEKNELPMPTPPG